MNECVRGQEQRQTSRARTAALDRRNDFMVGVESQTCPLGSWRSSHQQQVWPTSLAWRAHPRGI